MAMINRMLHMDWEKRATAQEILEDKWMNMTWKEWKSFKYAICELESGKIQKILTGIIEENEHKVKMENYQDKLISWKFFTMITVYQKFNFKLFSSLSLGSATFILNMEFYRLSLFWLWKLFSGFCFI
jgi:hypothetical protein